MLRSECPPPRDSWLFAEGKHEGIVRGMTLEECPGNHPVITLLSPRNHPLLSRVWKYVACMLMVLFVGVGNMWADVLWESDMQASIDGVTQTSNKVTYDNSLSFAWASDYTKGLHFTAGSAYVNLAYSSAIELKEGDVIRFYTGCSGTTARTLSLFLNNGSSAVATQSVVGSILNVLEYKLTADLTLNSVKVTCGGADAYLFKMYIYRDAPATGETTISCAFTYKGSNVKGWTNNCITTISGFSTSLSLVGEFATSGNNGLAGCSGEITGQPTTKPDVWDKTKYADIQFTIADGYTFTPTATSFKWSSNNSAYEAKIAIIDENNEIESNVSSSTGTQGTMDAFTFASDAFTGKKLSGSVHLRIYMRGANKRAWLGSPFTITGTVAPNDNYTITYDANGGTGTMENSTNNVADCEFTYSGKDFVEWNTKADGTGEPYAPGDKATSGDLDLYAIWTDHVAKYTLIYKVDGVEKGREIVNVVGGTPEGITAPTKDFYTFAGWSPALTDVTGTDGAEVETNATWTPKYASSIDLAKMVTDGTTSDIATILSGANYVQTDIAGEWGKTTEDVAYQGYKIKKADWALKFLVKAGKQVKMDFGSIADKCTLKKGSAAAEDIAANKGDGKSYSLSFTAAQDMVVEFKTTAKNTVTLYRISINDLFSATYTTSKSSVDPTSASNVSEVTLPTPSATKVTVEQKEYTFTGWTPSTDVKVGGEDKGTSDVLTAGTVVTLLDNTTFTAQWQEVTDFDVKFFPGYGENAEIGNTQKISTNGNADAPENPTRAGYKFLGWSTDGTEANIKDVATYAITTATTFTAVWKQVWTVTFDGAGNVEVENDEKVASPNSPVLAGKVFQGWYNDESKYDFSAAVTGNLALTSKWADADANHYVYAYNDDFHFDGVLYKTPEGKVDNTAGDNKNIAYTLYEGAEGITSVVLTNGSYDCKAGALNAVTSHIKLKNDASSKLVITIKEGYTATLKIKAAAYSGTRNYAVSDAEPAAATTAGRLVNDNAMNLSSLAEQTFALEAGTHNITANGGTLYISEMDIEAELIPTYTVTYAKGDEGASGEMTDANSYYAGDEVTLLNNTFGAPTGMIWSAWSVKDADNNDVEVVNGKFAMPASNVTVTAVWAVDNGMAKLYRSDDTEDAINPYATLVEAVAAAQNGDKIVLQRNVTDGAGIMLTTAQAKKITIDFGGFTYTAVSPGVGSTGTQNQAFHLEKGNTVTLKNGTIACSGSEIKMLIQNYCDLTLEDITLDGTGLEGSHRYVMSNNCGDVVIGDGTTIIAKTGDVAFDVCATNYYPDGVTVTVKDGASITGIVEYDVWGTKPAENKAELAIEGGEFNVTWNVEAALAEDAKENLNVSGGSFTEVVPVDYCAEGFVPVTEADPVSGKYEVTPGYKVTFVDGDEELETVGVKEGEAVAAIGIADKIGYEFDAWYTESTFENAWDFATVVAADMKLYAKWNVFEGCVMLKPAKTGDAISANDAIAMQEGSFGATMKALTDDLSYNTNGLLFGNSSSTKAEVTLSSNTLKAGTVITAVIYNDNDSKARGLSLLTKDGASVATWTATVVGTHTETYTVQAGDGLEGTNAFQLKREQNAYLQSIKITNCGAEPVTVTFKSANETLIAEEVIEKGTKVVAPAAPHVSGKRFIGWSETKNDAESLVNLTTTDIDADVTYYAVYEDVVCPTEGNLFTWAIDPEANGVVYNVSKNSADVDVASSAGVTTVKGANVTLGTGSSNSTFTITSGAIAIRATSSNYIKVVLDCALQAGDVISYTSDDANNRYMSIYKDEITGTAVTTSTDGKRKYVVDSESAILGADVLYMQGSNSDNSFKTFRIDRPYTISFDMQEHGAAIAAQKLLAGEKVAEPAAPTADGYDFFGWYKEAACTNAWDFDEDLVSASATLYAKWDVHRADIATLKSLKYGDNEILVADQYEYDIELPYATTAVPALSAVATSATAHSVDITNASAFDEDGKATSTVVVTAEDEVTTQTYWVHFTKAAALEQTLVTETTVWDWTKAGDNVNKGSTAQGVMANEIGIVNNADFNSQALWYKGQYPKRNDAYFQGAEIRIETTVPGVIYVEYSNTGGNNARTVEINGVKGLKSTDAANVKVVDSIAVNVGTVVIKGIQVSDNAAKDLRISKITFNTAADYTREKLNPSNIGTLCWESNAMLIGATLYELAGKNENGYLVFDEVSENRLEAGKGYVFVPENGNTEIKVYNTDKKMAKTEPENVEVGLQGTFEELTSAEGENSPLWDNYIITNNHFVHINSTNVGVRANRAYIRGFESIPQAGAPQQASNGAPRRRLVMEGNPAPATATDIDNIFGNDTKAEKVLINGQLFILRGGKMFDAAGQLVK